MPIRISDNTAISINTYILNPINKMSKTEYRIRTNTLTVYRTLFLLNIYYFIKLLLSLASKDNNKNTIPTRTQSEGFR